MYVVHHRPSPADSAPGHRRVLAAGREFGITCFEATLHTLDAGGTLTPRASSGESAAVVLNGGGKLLVDGAPYRFHAPCTLLLPAGDELAIVNNGVEQLQLLLIAALIATS
jgi:quercetin dioxygenase-like cupin family protein